MKLTEILDLIRHGEGPRTEFKRELGDLRSVGRAICAFANTEGGVIILGVDDSQEIVGVNEDVTRVQERLTSYLQTACNAPVSAQIDYAATPNGSIHWIEVPRQRSFEPLRFRGQVWVRRARSTVEPSPNELQELYNAFGYILTEERVIGAASTTDIDIQHFQSYLGKLGLNVEGAPQPSEEDDLRNRAVIADFDGGLRPTLYGVLAFGIIPQSYPQTRNFMIQCCAYAGNDRASDVLQVADITGRLDDQVQRAMGWFVGLGHTETYDGVIRTDRYLLPRPAIREALVNAVVHRDYSITGSKILLEVFRDRVNVTSPGALPNHMTVESVRAGAHPRTRNELMAYYMLTLGFMEQRGRGWPVMRRLMRDFNGTEPDIDQDEGSKFVRVTFWLESKT